MDERAEKVEQLFNSMPKDAENIGREMIKAHPTIQQNFMRGIAAFILVRAKDEYVDMRNEATQKLCVKLAEVLREEGNVFGDSNGYEGVALPFI